MVTLFYSCLVYCRTIVCLNRAQIQSEKVAVYGGRLAMRQIISLEGGGALQQQFASGQQLHWVRVQALPNFFFRGKLIDVAEVNQWPWLEESGQQLFNNRDRTHQVLTRGKPVLQKRMTRHSHPPHRQCRLIKDNTNYDIVPLSTVLSSGLNKSQQHQEKNSWDRRE